MSKKRKRNKSQPSKPRKVILQFQMGDAMASSLHIVNGELIFTNKDGKCVFPRSGTIRNEYERPKGPKVLSSAPLIMERPLRYSPDHALLPYDTVLAVDSNTRNIHGLQISVAAIVVGRWRERRLPLPILDIGPTQAIEYRNVKCHPDLLAWMQILKGVERNPDFRKEGGLALIVDSHLGDIPKIQAREKPILDDFYLPEWVTIFFASDVATDGVVNQALRKADVFATDLLDQIERYASLPNNDLGHGEHCEYMHVWSYVGP